MASLDHNFYRVERDGKPSYVRIAGGDITPFVEHFMEDCRRLSINPISLKEFQIGRASLRRERSLN